MYTGNKQSDREIILQFIWKRGKFSFMLHCNHTPPMYTGNKQSDREIILQFIWKRGKKGARQPTNQPTDRTQQARF